MLLFWTFYSSKNPGKIYNGFTIQSTNMILILFLQNNDILINLYEFVAWYLMGAAKLSETNKTNFDFEFQNHLFRYSTNYK